MSVERCMKRAPTWFASCASLSGRTAFIFSASSGLASTSAGLEIAAQFTMASGKASRTARCTAFSSSRSQCRAVTLAIGGSSLLPQTAIILWPSEAAALTKL